MNTGKTTAAPVHTPYPTEGGDELIYVPSLTVTWDKATKIVGKDDSEFLSDFLLIQDSQNRWHGIGIGGQGHVQDSFFHAVGEDLLERFDYTTRVESGGSQALDNMDWMWAPYAYRADDETTYLYYCHWDKTEGAQMRILKSDGAMDTWTPLQEDSLEDGNIAFQETAARDACVFFDEASQKYFMYYAVTDAKQTNCIQLRTSEDLIHWSEPESVMTAAKGFVQPESPFVIKRFGYYYLFVSGVDYGRVAVYASRNPADFGDPDENKLGEISGHAPEIVSLNGRDYIACAAIHTKTGGEPAQHDLSGVYLQELQWVKKEDAKWLTVEEPDHPPILNAEADWYWNFDGNVTEQKHAGAISPDISGLSFSGGVLGKAAEFDGETAISQTGTVVKLGQTFTLSFYMNTDYFSDSYSVLFSNGPKVSGHFEVYLHPNGTICFYQYELGAHDTDGFVADGEWHHVMFVYDGANIICYLDGEICYQEKAGGSPAASEEAIRFGSLDEELYYYMGALDELKIFNRALTQEDIG